MTERTVEVIPIPGDEIVASYEAAFLPRKDDVLNVGGIMYRVDSIEHVIADLNGRGLKPTGTIVYVRPAYYLQYAYSAPPEDDANA